MIYAWSRKISTKIEKRFIIKYTVCNILAVNGLFQLKQLIGIKLVLILMSSHVARKHTGHAH